MGTLHLTTRVKASEYIQIFMELKDKLDKLSKGYIKSAYMSKFLANVPDSDYTEDARALERSSATLNELVKALR